MAFWQLLCCTWITENTARTHGYQVMVGKKYTKKRDNQLQVKDRTTCTCHKCSSTKTQKKLREKVNYHCRHKERMERKSTRLGRKKGHIAKEKNSAGGREIVTAVIDESHDCWMSHPSVHFTAQDHTLKRILTNTHTNAHSL